jgi:serine/threonine-protein kinase RsbW
MTNALIHGNREDPTKIVNICGGCTERSELVIGITDQGEGFDPFTLPDPTAEENLYEGHGRGVFLMKRLVDKLEFNLRGRQVILRMAK